MMVRRTNPMDFGKDEGLIHEGVVKLREAGAGKLFWKSLLEKESFRRKVVELAQEHSFLDYVYGKYMSPALQLQLARDMNKHFNWGFNDSHFASLNTLPQVGLDVEYSRKVPVLDITLGTSQETFNAAINCLKLVYEEVSLDFKLFDKQPLAAGSALFDKGLRWVLVDFAPTKPKNKTWEDFLDEKNLTLANSAGLWFLFYFYDFFRTVPLQVLGPNVRGYLVEYDGNVANLTDNICFIVGDAKLTMEYITKANSVDSNRMVQKML